MPQHQFLAFTNPVPGVESAFNSWYDRKHVSEVLRYGRGFTGCRRFKLEAETRRGVVRPWAYLALYDLDFDDLRGLAENSWAQESPPLTPFRGLLESDHVAWVYTPRGARVSSESSRGASTAAPDSRPLSPHLLLQWAQSPSVKDDADLQNIVSQTDGCLAARAYELAHAQRRKQLESPWSSLVIYEMQSIDAWPAGKVDAAWRYTAVSDHVSRDAVMAAVAGI